MQNINSSGLIPTVLFAVLPVIAIFACDTKIGIKDAEFVTDIDSTAHYAAVFSSALARENNCDFKNAVDCNEIFVSPNRLAKQGTGSKISPYNSIIAALKIAKPGSVIHLLKGTYQGPIHFPRGGTEGKPITLTSDGPARSAIIDCQGERVNCIEINFGNIVVDGLEVKNAGFSGIKVDGDLHGKYDPVQSYGRYAGNSYRYNYANGADNVTLRNNYVHDIGYDGIKVSHTNNTDILNNEIFKTGLVHLVDAKSWQQGIDAVGVYNSIIQSNYIHDDSQNPVMAVGMFVKGGSEKILIENNFVENIASPNAAIEIGGDTEWYNTRYTPANVPGLNDRILLQDHSNNEVNVVGLFSKDSSYNNSYLAEARGVVVRGNIIKNADPAFSVRNGYNTVIYNNTALNCGWTQSWLKLWNDGTKLHRTENTILVNNIFYNNKVLLCKSGRYKDKSLGTEYNNIKGFVADNNIFWNKGNITFSGLGAFGYSDVDKHSNTIDPMLDERYRPKMGSPAIGSGIKITDLKVVSFTEWGGDRYGVRRHGNKIVIGALEHVSK